MAVQWTKMWVICLLFMLLFLWVGKTRGREGPPWWWLLGSCDGCIDLGGVMATSPPSISLSVVASTA